MRPTNPLEEICRGRWSPDISRLDWLSALVADYCAYRDVAVQAGAEIEDADAEATMLAEVEGLLHDLRQALGAAQGCAWPGSDG